jgi:hypothetical protein
MEYLTKILFLHGFINLAFMPGDVEPKQSLFKTIQEIENKQK